MKRFAPLASLLVCVALVFVAATWVQIRQTAAGYQIGTAADHPVGFFGATPVVQQTAPAAQTNTFSESSIALRNSTNTSTQAAVSIFSATGTSTQVALTADIATMLSNVTLNLSTCTVTDVNNQVVIVVTNATLTLATGPSIATASVNTVYGYAAASPEVVVTNSTINTVYGYAAASPEVVVTNATVGSIFGFETAARGSNTTSAINTLRTILRNLGLAL